MGKYLKKFETTAEYETFIASDYDKPNVSLTKDNDVVHYNPYVPPQPIAPVGKVQVFANPQCTAYADGYCKDVWVRLNQGFGFNDSLTWGHTTEEATYLIVGTPTTEFPNDNYIVMPWIDWISDEYVEPFTSGQIVKCSFGYGEPALDNVQVIFE